eukprot:symbB.v1.2.012712.t1/scaffold882.1/size155402/7
MMESRPIPYPEFSRTDPIDGTVHRYYKPDPEDPTKLYLWCDAANPDQQQAMSDERWSRVAEGLQHMEDLRINYGLFYTDASTRIPSHLISEVQLEGPVKPRGWKRPRAPADPAVHDEHTTKRSPKKKTKSEKPEKLKTTKDEKAKVEKKEKKKDKSIKKDKKEKKGTCSMSPTRSNKDIKNEIQVESCNDDIKNEIKVPVESGNDEPAVEKLAENIENEMTTDEPKEPEPKKPEPKKPEPKKPKPDQEPRGRVVSPPPRRVPQVVMPRSSNDLPADDDPSEVPAAQEDGQDWPDWNWPWDQWTTEWGAGWDYWDDDDWLWDYWQQDWQYHDEPQFGDDTQESVQGWTQATVLGGWAPVPTESSGHGQ